MTAGNLSRVDHGKHAKLPSYRSWTPLLEKIKKNEEDYGRDREIGTKVSKLKERKSEMKKNKNKESFLKTREAS